MLFRAVASVLSLTLLAFASPSMANNGTYPSKPIRIIVPWPAGGAADFLARQISHGMSARLSTPVIVDNRPGAATNIGTQAAANADADGYTLLMASSNNCVNVALYPRLPFDFAKSFKAVSNVGIAPNILVVNPAVPATDVKGLIAYAKSHPDVLTYGSSGNGSASHLAAEQFKAQAAVKILGIPYKGSAPAVTDLLGNQVSMMFTVVPPTLGHIKAGKLKIIGVASKARLPLFPDVPTISEAGLPGFESSIWYGLVAPSGTPDDIVAKLQSTVASVLQDPKVIDSLKQQGVQPVGDSSKAFAATISNDIQKYGALIKTAHITAE
ncbi:Bug family tripartite tricarboxylate transporter substrate binding protein [Cupriavidus oxalaticus]|uniref:Tripartite tricarboxylate transporter substrate binding protein n=1 Tax=Cupriavidus oxalaticus TaxID=96344 RepID=A0A5P3VTL1_9BURK|nr:tripartite tricarboxylate transporter substrate binding protein [Cupriavidus oxalaticus]QEZ48782.1 tripartite tricarboxylate transporter substrate binding protein [Cupriavidus oxalaticus]